jgi:hypothetical protein
LCPGLIFRKAGAVRGVQFYRAMPDDDDPAPACPKCDEPMKLDRVTPRFAGHPELRTFACVACREVLTFSEGEDC